MAARGVGLLAGYVADRAFGDPRTGHPVAVFGSAAGALERLLWADSRARGVGYLACCVLPVAVLGGLLERAPGRAVGTALATWAVLGGRGLAREGTALAGLLESGDLPGARRRLAHLCGRDAATLDAAGIARAATESVAENTSDAVVAPLCWGALAGIPGLLVYRALNTLDAMVGHRGPRHARFGWAAARADDVANLLPARLTATLAAVCSPRPAAALRAWRQDAGQHPSPNAGPVEAAFAGALGVRLGGRNTYAGVVSQRGTLGDGPAPGPADLRRAVRLSTTVGAVAALGCAVAAR